MSVVSPDAGAPARGVVFVHACPRAHTVHLEWALAGVLGVPVRLSWTPQPVAPDQVRAEASWRGPAGTGAALVSALLPFRAVRFEVTEEPSLGRDGERYAHTPALGLYRATIGPCGDLAVSEDRLRVALRSTTGRADLVAELERLLGAEWDADLEPFRRAGEPGAVRVLHRTG